MGQQMRTRKSCNKINKDRGLKQEIKNRVGKPNQEIKCARFDFDDGQYKLIIFGKRTYSKTFDQNYPL